MQVQTISVYRSSFCLFCDCDNFVCLLLSANDNLLEKMNRNLHSPTKLTEFARDFDIEPDTFFAKFVNKITNVYNSGYNTVNVVPARQGFLHG